VASTSTFANTAACPNLGPTEQSGAEAHVARMRDDYATAMTIYRQFAERGDANAQTQIAKTYTEGQGVPFNAAEAAKCYRLASDQYKHWPPNRGDYARALAFSTGRSPKKVQVMAESMPGSESRMTMLRLRTRLDGNTRAVTGFAKQLRFVIGPLAEAPAVVPR